MKKLLAIVASALTLGAFADASKMPATFELPEGLEADTVQLVHDGYPILDITVSGSTVNLDTNDLAAGDYWLALADGTRLTEVFTIKGTEEFIYSRTLAGLKLAGEGDNELIIADGTLESPVEKTAAELAGKAVTIKSGCVLKLTASGNCVVTISGEDATSTLLLNTSHGFDEGSKFANLTMQICPNKTPWFETRTSAPYDETVNLVIPETTQAVFSNNGNMTFGSITIDGGTCRNNTNKPATATVTNTLYLKEGATKPDCILLAEGAATETIVVRTITVKDWTFESFTYDGGDAKLGSKDIVLIPSTLEDNNAQWQSQNLCPKFNDHAVILEKEMNWKASVGRMTINGTTAYLYSSQAGKILSGAVVDGSGTLECREAITVEGPATISCTINFNGGSFKLVDGATLTVAEKLADGKVTTDVEKKRVGYNESTKTYSLIQQREMTVRVVENTTRYYLNAKDENGTSTEMIAIEGNSVLIDNGTGFTAYYIANEGYELSKTADGAKISSDKKMVWYYFTTVTSDQNYDAQVTATAVAPAVPGIDLIPEDQKTGYPAWLEANITTETTLEVEDIVAAFLLGATVSEGVTIEDAAQAKVEELLKDIDLSALATEGEDAALTTLNAKLADMGLEAALDPVSLEGVDSDTTKLYKLVITLKTEN